MNTQIWINPLLMAAGTIMLLLGFAGQRAFNSLDINTIKAQDSTIKSLEKINNIQKERIEILSSTIESKDKLIEILKNNELSVDELERYVLAKEAWKNGFPNLDKYSSLYFGMMNEFLCGPPEVLISKETLQDWTDPRVDVYFSGVIATKVKEQ